MELHILNLSFATRCVLPSLPGWFPIPPTTRQAETSLLSEALKTREELEKVRDGNLLMDAGRQGKARGHVHLAFENLNSCLIHLFCWFCEQLLARAAELVSQSDSVPDQCAISDILASTLEGFQVHCLPRMTAHMNAGCSFSP